MGCCAKIGVLALTRSSLLPAAELCRWATCRNRVMRIIIQSDSDVVDLFKGLELLTNAAKVTLASITVDGSRNEITIPMQRRSYERRRLLTFGESLNLVSPEWTDSRLIIKNVVDRTIRDNLHLPDILLLFGVAIKNKEIRFCSAEEQSGVMVFEMSINVQSYDVELRDERGQI